jgi:hypothetical protein
LSRTWETWVFTVPSLTAHLGSKELARLSLWPELGLPARSGEELIPG